jgi:hypothetical protein
MLTSSVVAASGEDTLSVFKELMRQLLQMVAQSQLLLAARLLGVLKHPTLLTLALTLSQIHNML